MVILTWGGFQRDGLYFSSWCIPRARRHIHAGIWGGKKRRRVKKKSRIVSFFYELPSFFFFLPSPHRTRDVTLLRSLPQMDSVYINNHLRVQGTFDWCVIVQRLFPGIWIDIWVYSRRRHFSSKGQRSVVGVEKGCPLSPMLFLHRRLQPACLLFTGEIDWHLNRLLTIMRWLLKLRLRSACQLCYAMYLCLKLKAITLRGCVLCLFVFQVSLQSDSESGTRPKMQWKDRPRTPLSLQ